MSKNVCNGSRNSTYRRFLVTTSLSLLLMGSPMLGATGWAQEYIDTSESSGLEVDPTIPVRRGLPQLEWPDLSKMSWGQWGVREDPTVNSLIDRANDALKLGRASEAAATFQKLVNTSHDVQRAKARLGLAMALAQLGQDDAALKALESTPSDDSMVGQQIGRLRGELVLQLAEKAWWDADSDQKGKEGLSYWLRQYDRLMIQPNVDRSARLHNYLIEAETEMARMEGPLVVAVVVPLSGPLAEVGQDILNGMQIGLAQRAGRGGNQVLLKPYDSANGAQSVTEQALSDGAQLIVGPLRASEVPNASALAKKAGVPMLSLSSDRSTTENGVWSVAFSPSDQAREVARWATAQGHANAAGLIPDNDYGRQTWEAFQAEMKKLGGSAIKASYFNPEKVDLSASIRTLIAGVKPVAKEDGQKPSINPGFTALFVPAPAASMALIQSQLNYYDLDVANNGAGLQLLGTALWQNPISLDAKNRAMQGTVFSVPGKSDSFNQAYQSEFAGSDPTPLASVGADAGRIVSDLARLYKQTRTPVTELLLRPEGFPGYGGYIRFGNNGFSERGQAVVQVSKSLPPEQTSDVSGTSPAQAEAVFRVIMPALTMAPIELF